MISRRLLYLPSLSPNSRQLEKKQKRACWSYVPFYQVSKSFPEALLSANVCLISLAKNSYVASLSSKTEKEGQSQPRSWLKKIKWDKLCCKICHFQNSVGREKSFLKDVRDLHKDYFKRNVLLLDNFLNRNDSQQIWEFLPYLLYNVKRDHLKLSNKKKFLMSFVCR